MRNKLRRPLAFLLCAALTVTMPGSPVYAAADSGQSGNGLCAHHAVHTDECGYTEGTPGVPCVHEHTEDCYVLSESCVHEHTGECYPASDGENVSGNAADLSEAEGAEATECAHVCSEESGCITRTENCTHVQVNEDGTTTLLHDDVCGYAEAQEAASCQFVCEECIKEAAEAGSGEVPETEPENGAEAGQTPESKTEVEPETENGAQSAAALLTTFADDQYNAADVAVVNAIIANNGLSATLDDPASWEAAELVRWDASTPKRIVGLNIRNQLLSGGLDVSGLTNLQELDCSLNQLSSLDASNLTNLTKLYCHYNQLHSLNMGNLTNPEELLCNGNQLSSLDVSNLTSLEILKCDDNQLSSLDVSNLETLTRLSCSDNQLNSLNVNNTRNLTAVVCANNPLTELTDKGGYTLTITQTDHGTAMISEYTSGGSDAWITFAAQPDEKYGFAEWKGLPDGASSSLNPYKFHVSYSLYGNFNVEPVFKLSSDRDGNGYHDGDEAAYRAILEAHPKLKDFSGSDLDLNNPASWNVIWNEESPKRIRKLALSEKQMTGRLDVSSLTGLEDLDCSYNQLTELDMNGLSNLQDLSCNNNQLTSLTDNVGHKLKVTKTGGGTALITNYAFPDRQITLNAAPAEKYYFVQWEGLPDGIPSDSTPVEFTLSNTLDVKALFQVEPSFKQALTEDMIEAIPDQIYTGQEISPEPVVSVDIDGKNVVFEKGVDFTYGYTDNTNVGTASVIITPTANGQLTGEAVTKTFIIGWLETEEEAVLSGTQGENDWYASDVTVSAPDGYTISGDGTDWNSPLTISKEGANLVQSYYLKNADGQIAKKSVTVNIDKTAPVIESVAAEDVTMDTAHITVTAMDELSGISDYKLSGDGILEQTNATGEFSLSGLTPGTEYNLTVTVTDKAGKTSTETVSFKTQEAVASVTGADGAVTMYKDLDEAAAEAREEAKRTGASVTLTLLKDVSGRTKTLDLSVYGGNLIFDLGGHTLSGRVDSALPRLVAIYNGEVEIRNGTVQAEDVMTYAVGVYSGGVLSGNAVYSGLKTLSNYGIVSGGKFTGTCETLGMNAALLGGTFTGKVIFNGAQNNGYLKGGIFQNATLSASRGISTCLTPGYVGYDKNGKIVFDKTTSGTVVLNFTGEVREHDSHTYDYTETEGENGTYTWIESCLFCGAGAPEGAGYTVVIPMTAQLGSDTVISVDNNLSQDKTVTVSTGQKHVKLTRENDDKQTQIVSDVTFEDLSAAQGEKAEGSVTLGAPVYNNAPEAVIPAGTYSGSLTFNIGLQ